MKAAHPHHNVFDTLVLQVVTLTGPESQEVQDFYWNAEDRAIICRYGPEDSAYQMRIAELCAVDPRTWGRALTNAVNMGVAR